MKYMPLYLLLVVCLFGAFSRQAGAQEAAHLNMQVEVLPPALSVTVTSSQLDFAEQRPRIGQVLLDPVTGEISAKADGAHRIGEVRLAGPAGSAYGLTVTPTPWLKQTTSAAASPEASLIGYRLRWARANGCAPTGFREIHDVRSTDGAIGADGCTVFRFGGSIALADIPGGRYGGSLHVSIFTN